MGRLIAFAAKSYNRGLGVDESTAVLLERIGGKWNWTVSGEGNVYIVTPSSSRVFPKYQDGLRLTYGPINVYRIAPGAVNVVDVLAGSASYQVKVSRGTVYTTDNGRSLY